MDLGARKVHHSAGHHFDGFCDIVSWAHNQDVKVHLDVRPAHVVACPAGDVSASPVKVVEKPLSAFSGIILFIIEDDHGTDIENSLVVVSATFGDAFVQAGIRGDAHRDDDGDSCEGYDCGHDTCWLLRQRQEHGDDTATRLCL